MHHYYRMNYSGYFTENFPAHEQSELHELKRLSKAETAQDADIIITSSDTNPKEIPSSAKLVIHPNSGYDLFSLEWLKERDIPVIVGSPIRQYAVSEYYISAIFHHFSSLPINSSWDVSRAWSRKLVKDQRVLIYGYGHIGGYLKAALERICKDVVIVDPFKNINPTIGSLADFNIVISAFGLNESTKNYFGQKFFGECREDVLFLHASRGKQIDITALVSFLTKNQSAAAYVDVFPQEPFPLESINLPNLKASCHVAGVYENIEETLIQFEKSILLDYISLERNDFLKKYEKQNLNERKNHSFLI